MAVPFRATYKDVHEVQDFPVDFSIRRLRMCLVGRKKILFVACRGYRQNSRFLSARASKEAQAIQAAA